MLEIKELKNTNERTLIRREAAQVFGGDEAAGTTVTVDGALHPDEYVGPNGGTEYAVVNDHYQGTYFLWIDYDGKVQPGAPPVS
jgi:hypothetical protein